MRQRSIAGPIILIGLGVLFLLNNLRPDLSFWANFARYWPFLLIVFGVLRLAEVLVDAGRGNPIVTRPRGGGGGLGLIIFLCVIFWAFEHGHRGPLHLGIGDSSWNNGSLEIFGDQFDYPISGKGDASGVTLVVLEGLRGNVTVTGADADEYSAEGRKTIRAYNKSEADEADRKSPVKFVREGNQLLVKIDESGVSKDRKVSTEIDLTVPRHVNVEARGRSGDVTVSAITGTVDISTDRGDVRLNDTGGDAKLSIAHSGLIRVVDSKGSVGLDGRGADVQMENIGGEVTVNGSYSGTLEFKKLDGALRFQSPQTDMRVEKIPGSLTLDLGDLRANNVTGPMRFHTKSRDVHIEDFTDALDLDMTDRGDIEVSTAKGPLGKVDLHTRNGNIDLALPETAAFDLRANTSQGDAHNEYGPAIKLGISGRSASLNSVDAKGVAVIANTDRGSISVRKSQASKD
jgi:DUF4097 and DUF4098 domain-containing protein YvlB